MLLLDIKVATTVIQVDVAVWRDRFHIIIEHLENTKLPVNKLRRLYFGISTEQCMSDLLCTIELPSRWFVLIHQEQQSTNNIRHFWAV